MIIKLTNAATQYAGTPLLINTDYILSVFEDQLDSTPITMVYSNTKESWQVKETVDEVYRLSVNCR